MFIESTGDHLAIEPSNSTIDRHSWTTLVANRKQREVLLTSQCDRQSSSTRKLDNAFRYNAMLNHLGFLLRSHSLFYCAVPKVGTRTFLNIITYLHLRDELIPSFSSVNQSSAFNATYFARLLSSPAKVNIADEPCQHAPTLTRVVSRSLD
jgi:hypothetical protein